MYETIQEDFVYEKERNAIEVIVDDTFANEDHLKDFKTRKEFFILDEEFSVYVSFEVGKKHTREQMEKLYGEYMNADDIEINQ